MTKWRQKNKSGSEDENDVGGGIVRGSLCVVWGGCKPYVEGIIVWQNRRAYYNSRLTIVINISMTFLVIIIIIVIKVIALSMTRKLQIITLAL